MSLEELRGILLTERESGKVTSLPVHLFERTHEEITQLQDQVYATEDPFSSESQMLIEKVASIRVTIEEIFSIRSSKIVSLAQSHADGSFIDREELKLLHPDELSMFHRVVEAIRECRSVLIDRKITEPPSSPFSATYFALTPHSLPPHAPSVAPETIHSERVVSSFSSPPAERGTDDRFNISESFNADDLRDEMHSASLAFDDTVQNQESSSAPGVSETEGDSCVVFEGKDIIDSFSDSKAYSLVLVVADMEPFMGVDGYVYEIRSGDIITLPRKNAAVLTERNIVLNIKSS